MYKAENMTKALHNFLVGFGSVIDLFPSTNYQKFVPTKTSDELIAQSFQEVGQSLQIAIDTFKNEQEEQAIR